MIKRSMSSVIARGSARRVATIYEVAAGRLETRTAAEVSSFLERWQVDEASAALALLYEKDAQN
jgi:hypothetical protein